MNIKRNVFWKLASLLLLAPAGSLVQAQETIQVDFQQVSFPRASSSRACRGGCQPNCGCQSSPQYQGTPQYQYQGVPQYSAPQNGVPQTTQQPNFSQPTDPGQDAQFQNVDINPVTQGGGSNFQLAGLGASRGGEGSKHMIGDFFGNAGVQSKFFEETAVLLGGDFVGVEGYFPPGAPGTIPAVPGTYSGLVSTDDDSPFTAFFDGASADIVRCIILPTPGGNVGRLKVADNNMALPMDRLIFDYNFFYNVPLTQRGINVNRFTPGFEKAFTCCDVLSSVEVLFPMAATLDSDFAADSSAAATAGEFGNINIITKTLLCTTENTFLSGGIGITLPTASDVNVTWTNDAFGDSNFVHIDNDSVHLAPYLALLHETGDTFIHAFAQVDFDLNGNDVSGEVNPTLNGPGVMSFGTLQDQTLLFLDVGLGHWIYHNPHGLLNRVALAAELHYTSSISSADFVFLADDSLIGDPDADIDLLNGTVGIHAECGLTTFTFGYGVPLTSSDRVFDGELRCFVNRRF
jgi:hypothetical protein